MYYVVTVACLIWVYFTSSSSLTVEHGLIPGVKLNESIKDQIHKEKDVIDQYAITDVESDIESSIHSKHKLASGRQEEDSKAEPDTFSIESFLNLFSVDIGHNGPSPRDSKDNQTNMPKYKNEGDSVIHDVDINMQKENKSESQEHESKGQQSHGLSSGGLLVQYEHFPLENDTKNLQLDIEGNTGYANTLHMVDIKDLESVKNIKEEDVLHNDSMMSRDDIEVKKENIVKEENGTKTGIILGGLIIKQTESPTGEQQKQPSDSIVKYNRIRGDVPNVGSSIEIPATAQNDENTDKTRTVLLENPSELLLSHHDHGVDAAIQKKGESLEMHYENISADPCIHFHCKRGRMCETDGHGNPICVCQDLDLCLPGNRNDLVCGTDNKTYPSTCHLFGTKCVLEGTKEGNHLHLDYQGPCKYIPPCTEYELAHFPFRMRDWLKNVLMQLYERDQENTGLLSEKQKSKMKKIYENEKRLQEGDHNIELLVKDFQKNYNMYVYPVHWQFHQLDQHQMDRLLTHSELAALRAPLIPIEHCVNMFLQECNTNNDRHISLWEWCRCFGIKEDDIDEDLLF